MKRPVSFLGLFGEHDDRPYLPIRAISIPVIQRDYAQGRPSPPVKRIRERFLDALHESLTQGTPRTLDFVYGEVRDGRLVPLDGQQRLTTLFLLHVYVAARARVPLGIPEDALTYETRPSARRFCRYLVTTADMWAESGDSPGTWLEDQAWFTRSWDNDPTISGMCTMLDAIDRRFSASDPHLLWSRLRDPEVINFYFLGLGDFGLTDALYISMNARGRPLTPFENFKGRFERLLCAVDEPLGQEFKHKVDKDWDAMLWYCAGDDRVVDDQMMRYLAFLTDVCGRLGSTKPVAADSEPLADTVERHATTVFGTPSPACRENLAFMVKAFDCWCGTPTPKDVFEELFALNAHDPGKVTLYSKLEGVTVDLLSACAWNYTLTDGRRVFALRNTLLLYAVLLHRIEDTPHIAANLRVVRNLGEHTDIKLSDLAGLLRDVETIMHDGPKAVGFGSAFRNRQLEEEVLKVELRNARPELAAVLNRLEDHPLLRGCLAAFDLKAPDKLAARARAFADLFTVDRWPLVWRALLATGDFSTKVRDVAWDNRLQLSVPDKRAWLGTTRAQSLEHLLTGTRTLRMKTVLTKLLDLVSEKGNEDGRTDDDAMHELVSVFLTDGEIRGERDWRWYLLKYPAMLPDDYRDTGVYVGLDGRLGPSLCKLRTAYTGGYYRDPYLVAVVRSDGTFADRTWGTVWEDDADPWHTGDEKAPRWLTLTGSGVRFRFDEAGVVVAPAEGQDAIPEASVAALDTTRPHEVGDDGQLRFPLPQTTVDGVLVDGEDRIRVGADLLRALLGVAD
jgi:hypothetical protein